MNWVIIECFTKPFVSDIRHGKNLGQISVAKPLVWWKHYTDDIWFRNCLPNEARMYLPVSRNVPRQPERPSAVSSYAWRPLRPGTSHRWTAERCTPIPTSAPPESVTLKHIWTQKQQEKHSIRIGRHANHALTPVQGIGLGVGLTS